MKDLINSKYALIPSWFELMVYVVSAFLLIVYSLFDNILVVLTGEASSETLRQQISEAFERLFSQFLEQLEASELMASLTVAMFWALIGVISYFIVQRIQKFIIEAEDDLLMETQYVHPRQYNHIIFWVSFAARVLFRVSMIVLLVIYVLFAIEVLVPLWLQLIEGWLDNVVNLSSFANAILAYTGMIATLHFLVVIWRAVFIKRVT